MCYSEEDHRVLPQMKCRNYKIRVLWYLWSFDKYPTIERISNRLCNLKFSFRSTKPNKVRKVIDDCNIKKAYQRSDNST